MFYKSFIFFILFIASTTTYAASKSFDYYSDGVYDAYTEIENSLRRGLKEEKIKDLGKKWLVIQDISNDSTVQIIFYRTVAHKNNFFEAVIAKNKLNNKNYMVYGSFSRKADAKYASKKLLEKGISAKVVYSRNDTEYSTNPIVVKKLIVDMKKLLKDTPVVVIRKTIILDSNRSNPNIFHQKCKKIVKTKIKTSSYKTYLDKIVLKEFIKLKAKWKTRVTVDNKRKIVIYSERSGFVNHYKIKDYIKGFKITDIYYNKKTHYFIVKVLGINGKTYKLYKKQKTKNKTSHTKHHTKSKAKLQTKPKHTSEKANNSKKNIQIKKSNEFLCDFNKIHVAYLKNGKRTDIKSTHYYEKHLKVKITQMKDFYKIQHSGFETIYIKPFYFSHCQKI